MIEGPGSDRLHLERILTLVRLVRSRLKDVDFASYRANPDLIDATALRLASIGEGTRKLSADVKARHPSVPWEQMYRLRNIVAHHYDRIDPEIIWFVATDRIEELGALCQAELARLDQ